MKYQILYPGAFAALEVSLERGESIKAESDAMVSMDGTVDVEGTLDGGVLGGIKRALAGEKFFLQTLTAKRGPGKALLAPSKPGDVLDVELDGSYSLLVQKDGFLAGSPSLEIGTKMQNLVQGFLSGEGFFVLKIAGKGNLFLSSYGSIHAVNVPDGEELVVDNNHLVAWPDYMHFEITKASSGWISSLTSGEALVCRFRGPGPVLIQTRNPKGFASWLQALLPSSRGN